MDTSEVAGLSPSNPPMVAGTSASTSGVVLEINKQSIEDLKCDYQESNLHLISRKIEVTKEKRDRLAIKNDRLEIQVESNNQDIMKMEEEISKLKIKLEEVKKMTPSSMYGPGLSMYGSASLPMGL